VFKTSMTKLMRERNITPLTTNSVLGQSAGAGNYYNGLPFRHDFPIPQELIKPEVSFSFKVHSAQYNNEPLDPNHLVTCDFEVTTESGAAVTSVSAAPEGAVDAMVLAGTQFPGPTAIKNGRSSLRQHVFPLEKETNTLVLSKVPEVNLATYKLTFKKVNHNIDDFSEVCLKVRYNGETKDIGPSSTGRYSTFQRKLIGSGENAQVQAYTTINLAHVDGQFIYSPTARIVDLEFWPCGSPFTNENVAGFSPDSFKAMFNAKNLSPSYICQNGFNNENNRVSAFAQVHFIEAIRSIEQDLGYQMRCNDISLPFAPKFIIPKVENPKWSHTSHDTGLIGDFRYFNENSAAQDEYDSSDGAERRKDVNAYINFVNVMSEVAAASNDPISQDIPAVAKRRIASYCAEYASNCSPYAVDEPADLNLENLKKICQIFQDGDDPISGCEIANQPDDTLSYLSRIKRFSVWVEYNSNAMSALLAKKYIPYMGDGFFEPLTNNELDITIDWQRFALEYGDWWNGDSIMKVVEIGDHTYLEDTLIRPCFAGGCGLSKRFQNVGAHVTHFHLTVY
jgi:hypothetical protein